MTMTTGRVTSRIEPNTDVNQGPRSGLRHSRPGKLRPVVRVGFIGFLCGWASSW